MKRLLLVMSFSVALHGNITWQQAEVVSEPLGSIFTSGNTVAVDAAGNAINAFTYQITTPFITVATIHTAQGTAWGDLTASINTDEEILDNVFPGATGQFVVTMQSAGGGMFSRTVSLDGTLGDVKTITSSGAYFDPDTTDAAAAPSGNAMTLYANLGRNSSIYSFYTASTDTWSSPITIAQGGQVLTQWTAADAAENYGIVAVMDGGNAQTSFKIGDSTFTTPTVFDTGVDAESMAITAQVKTTDTDGMFMVAYTKSESAVYAQVKAAGTSTTMTNLGQISTSPDIQFEYILTNMNNNGDAIVAWLNNSNELLTAKYTAATNTFALPQTIATSVSRIHGLSSDINGNFHIFYITSGLAYENYSQTMLSTSDAWRTEILINTNPPGTISTNIGYLGTTNPRGTSAAYTWGLNNLTVTSAFGKGPEINHGGAASAPPQLHIYRARKHRRPFR